MALLSRISSGALLVIMAVGSALAQTGSSSALRESYSTLRKDLDNSPFKRPIRLVSTQASSSLKGEIHAVLTHPFERVRTGLSEVKSWCEIMLLDPNIYGCRPGTHGPQSFTIAVGRSEKPAEFDFRVTSAQSDYLQVQLSADEGPLGTRDFHIVFEATPLDPERTFIHFVYSHGFGLQAQMAMRAYLTTLGRDKVGFTVVGKTAEGKPKYVSDMRGALERNAMRYYIAIEAFLDAATAPPAQQFEKRLQTWFASTERYPLQLHEDPEYLERKRKIARVS
jgi:hypothetical protein